MQLISVNIGQEQPIQNAKSSGKTGIYKQPVSEAVRLTDLGLEGDVIIDTKNHGGYDQAVYIYGGGDYDWWSETLGQRLAPGTFGDNLTFSQMESGQYSIGDRFILDEVVLEVTAPRIPCVTLAARMGDPQFIKRFKDAERPGLYCRVIRPGMVKAGETVTVERYNRETVTIVEMFQNFYLKQPPEDYLRRYLIAPTPLKGREQIEAMLKK